MEYVTVFVTASTLGEAKMLSRHIVGEKLAACCSIIPKIISIYRWEGKVEEEGEAMLLIKTEKGQTEKLKERVMDLHSYETPEFIVVPITDGSTSYLKWISDNTANS